MRHAAMIPFENMDPLTQLPIALDLASLERKLIHQRRGGYCFEHNLLLRNVLLQMGFSVNGLLARVCWEVPATSTRIRGHMLLRVEIDNSPYIIDVGFGGLTLTGVLRLEPDTIQTTPHEAFRLIRIQNHFLMQADIRGEWRPVYQFDLQEQHPIDYEPINWYLSTCPQSIFTQHLMAARALPDRRYTLRNNQLTTHYLAGASESEMLRDADQLRDALENRFGLAVPQTAAIDAALTRASAF